MKWFKHMTGSWDDEGMASLAGTGGMNGLARYGLWWRTMEIVASQIDGKSETASVRYPVTRWSTLLSLRGSLVFSTLSTLVVTGGVTVERDGDDIIVTFSNLLKYRDEYSKKSGHSPDNNNKKENKKEKENKENKKEPPAREDHSRFSLPLWIDPEAWSGFEEMRKKIRAPLTDRARNGILSELQRIGGNPNAILDQSTRNSWRGVFPLKDAVTGIQQKPKITIRSGPVGARNE